MANGSLTPSRSALGSNVFNFSTARAAATVVDGILNYPMLMSRFLYKGKSFSGDGRSEQPTIIKDIKISGRSQFQWFDGLDQLNASAENVVVQLQFNDAHATMPLVEIMTDSFAREGSGEDVDYPAFEYEDALNETVEGLSTALFSAGSADQPLSLPEIVDDGSNLATYGGQTRASYDSLDATVTASGGTMTLAQLATLKSTISDTGPKERPTLICTTDTIADLYQQFLTPTVQYQASSSLSMGGMFPTAGKESSMNQGFGGVNTYDGVPIIRDKRSTSGVLYMLNENYTHWSGRTRVPKSFKEFVSPVKLGKGKVIEGQAAMKPSSYHGFFYQEKQMMPNQAGVISRFFVFGQLWSDQPRRNGKLTGITGV